MSLLDDEELAKLDLQRQLDRLRKYSQNCVRDAEQVKESFEAWQNYALQIRRACTSADGESCASMAKGGRRGS